jgi:hypothetical protein
MRQSFRFLSCTLLNLALAAYALPVAFAGEAAVPAVVPAATVAAPVWTMPESEKKALMAVVERAIAAGLPDAKGGTFMHGKITHKITRKTGSSSHTQDQSYDGLHLRLADGRLLMNLRWLMPTSGEGAVDISKLETVAPDKLVELGAKSPNMKQWNVEQAEAQLKKFFAEGEIQKVRAIFKAKELVILSQGYGDFFLPTMVMLRLQIPNAEYIALSGSLNELWDEDSAAVFAGKASVLQLMPDDQQSRWQERAKRMQQMKNLTLPPTALTLRRQAIRYFVGQLYVDENQGWQQPQLQPSMTAQQSATGALSMIDDSDVGAATLRAQIARFQQRAAIANDIAADADLATMLTWWGGSNQQTHMSTSDDADEDQGSAEELQKMVANMPADQRQQFITSRVLKRLRAVPIGELVALAGDQRTSRWVDGKFVRTVGDNALRALAERFFCDPRVLIARDPLAPWTDEERIATVKALQTWWSANQKKPMSELLAGAIGTMSVADLARLVTKAGDKDRADLLANMAKIWTTTGPKDPEPVALAQILFAAKASKALDAVVAPWPVSGRQRTVLAAWHQEHGKPTHVDALLADGLKPPTVVIKPTAGGTEKAPAQSGEDEEGVDLEEMAEADFSGGSSELRNALRLTMRYPTADRLNRVMAVITAPAKGDDGERLLNAVVSMSWGMQDELTALWGEDRQNGMSHFSNGEEKPDMEKRARAAVPLVLMGLLLNDQRPAPKKVVQQYSQFGTRTINGVEQKQLPPAADLRIADVAAMMFRQMSYSLPLDDLLGKRQQHQRDDEMDLGAVKIERDKCITTQRTTIAAALPLALKAANLPTAIPGVTDVVPVATGNDEPVF